MSLKPLKKGSGTASGSGDLDCAPRIRRAPKDSAQIVPPGKCQSRSRLNFDSVVTDDARTQLSICSADAVLLEKRAASSLRECSCLHLETAAAVILSFLIFFFFGALQILLHC